MAEADADLDALKWKIHRERGFNCHFYKEKCLLRRLLVRMRARGIDSYADYSALLDRDDAEYDLLLDALTINVSKFFRNPEIWASMEESVIPALFDFPPDQRRVWSAGCAGGEEPYSLSILLREWAERNARLPELDAFRILGTDIDRRSLAAARRAEYSDLALTEVPRDVLERWFSPDPARRLDPLVTRNVSFEWRDLISGPMQREVALILCRNVIIYFDRGIQEKLFQGFYDALVPGGFLVLGNVETLIGRPRSYFHAVNLRHRIFRKPP